MGKKDFTQTAAQQNLMKFFNKEEAAPGTDAEQAQETKKPIKKKASKKDTAGAADQSQAAEGSNTPFGYVLKKESKSQRATILFRQSTLKALKEKASEEGKSFNELCTEILENYLKGEATK